MILNASALSTLMLYFVMLNVMFFFNLMMSVTMPSAATLSVVMQNVIMLCVMVLINLQCTLENFLQQQSTLWFGNLERLSLPLTFAKV